MELSKEPEDVVIDAEDDEPLDLLFSDNNGSFACRRALDQFKGRHRQYGNAVCPECKQSFVNAARLERHLAVHQVFGAFLCPLCGKTYKYEYNLFFHWRKTCQYLNDLVGVEQRKELDVHSLRLLVEEVVVKKIETEPVNIGISTNALLNGGMETPQLELPIDPQSPLARSCTICGILIHKNHLPQHEALHSATTDSGMRIIDMKSVTGGYFCDLCGVAFRNRENLFTHWRSSCPEIMANLEPGSELYMSDVELKGMVLNLLWRLKRVSRQSPLRAIRTNRNNVEELEPTISHEGKQVHSDGSNPNLERCNESCSSSADSEGKALVFMDDYVDPADTLINIDGELVNVISADRGKWSIPLDGKPLECPDCFRQFANAGRLERHISGFHSHYGAFKCLLCGHRFKYDYNLLFHYRHSCAYTKLLVGADVRKLLDAASLRKLVSHIKESDPQLRPGSGASSRLVHIKRRPSLKAVPRNVRGAGSRVPAASSKRSYGLEEGKKCPVCGVLFYGEKSLDKHIGTVHLLNRAFLDKAITRESTPPIIGTTLTEVRDNRTGAAQLNEHPSVSHDRNDKSPEKVNGNLNGAEEAEAPPVLEVQTPGEAVPPPTRCVDVFGEEINDFDAEQLTEMDVMLYTGQLRIGDLVITSVYGEDVEYRIAVGTRHGSQIVLEKTIKASRFARNKEDEGNGESIDKQESWEFSGKSKSEKNHLRGFNYDHGEDYQGAEDSVDYDNSGEMVQYVEEETAQMEYESGGYGDYEVDEVEEGQKRERVIQYVDEERKHLVQYVDDEGEQCEGYVQFINDGSGQHVVGLIEGGEIVDFLDTENIDDANLAVLKSPPTSNMGREVAEGQLRLSGRQQAGERYPVESGSAVDSNMPEDFMQEIILEE
ncbi:hypothetical protein V3C99_013758 [Haemonchus contortus]